MDPSTSSSNDNYQPVDLSALCTVGVEVFDSTRYQSGGTWLNPDDGPTPQTGTCEFRGIPFQVGPTPEDKQNCFIDFITSTRPVTIPIGRRATNVIFAHVIVQTQMWIDGTHPGDIVATYRFRFDDGTETEIPIRERFEIGHCPQPWGHRPFLAYPDVADGLEERHRGEWARAGYRLTEVTMATTHAYTLWPWQNPHPSKTIEYVTIEPHRSGFIVAGVTTGIADEHPFQLPPRRPVRLSSDASHPPDVVDVSVDRGVATFAYPAADRESDRWTGHDGWGGVDGAAGAYAYVAATPSATLTVTTPEGSVQTPWEDALSGPVKGEGIRIRVEPPDRNWVHVTVKDEKGQPTPCRVSFASESGVQYAPHGHHAPVQAGLRAWNLDVGGDVLLGDVSYAYIDGTCQGWLPRGKVWVEAAKGFEYRPFKKQVKIVAGQRELELNLDRVSDLGAEGWHSGDTHVHFLSPDGALLEAEGEGLAVVNLLQAQWGHLFTNVEDFTGRTRVSPNGGVFVHVSQENRQHVLGHLNLLGLSKPVMPFSSDGASEAELGGGLDITTSRWADAAHESGGLVILAHMPTPNGETATLIATDRVDGLEMIDFNHFEHLEYYRYLNGGYRLPLVAGTDKMEATMPVGLYRTFANVDGELDFRSWMAAVKAGRTFASSGPILRFKVDGEQPGGEINRPVGSTVTVSAEVTSIFPIHTLQVVQGGAVVARVDAPDGATSLRLEEEVTISDHGWLAARSAGPGYQAGTRHFDHDRRPVMAHTSPVYIDTGERRPLAGDTFRYLNTLVHGGLDYIRQSIHDPDHAVTYHHGESDHRSYLEAPFLEASARLKEALESWEAAK